MKKVLHIAQLEPSTTVLWTEFLEMKGKKEQFRVVAQVDKKTVDITVLVDRANGRVIYPVPHVIKRLKWNEREGKAFRLLSAISEHLLHDRQTLAPSPATTAPAIASAGN